MGTGIRSNRNTQACPEGRASTCQSLFLHAPNASSFLLSTRLSLSIPSSPSSSSSSFFVYISQFAPVQFLPSLSFQGFASRMVSDNPDTQYDEEEDASTDEPLSGSRECRNNKNKRGRTPRKMLKAERERLKREHLNDLFTNLASALDISDPNNGKACILGEAIRLVKDLTSQIKCLGEENAALLSESVYVATERNELKDDTCSLESHIQKIKDEMMERARQLKPDLSAAERDADAAQQPHVVYVIPIGQNIEADLTTAKVASHVRKPNPRYPTPGDSWPLQLLQKQPY